MVLDNTNVYLCAVNEKEFSLDVDKLLQCLSAVEKQRLLMMKKFEVYRKYLLSRSILRSILGAVNNVPPKNIFFYYNEYGKPFVGNVQNRISFNLSHSGDYILFAFTGSKYIGIDIERIRRVKRIDLIVESYFSKKEKEIFERVPEKHKDTCFFTGWTKKEACGKAVGCGLLYPTKDFSISIIPKRLSRKRNCTEKVCVLNNKLNVIELDIHRDYAGALAVPENGMIVRYLNINKYLNY